MKLGAMLEPREKVNCGGAPWGAPNGKIGVEEGAPGAAVEATTGAGLDVPKSETSPGAKGAAPGAAVEDTAGAGFDVLKSEPSTGANGTAPGAAVEDTAGAGFDVVNSEPGPAAKGFGSEEAVLVLDVKETELGGRTPDKPEGGLTEVSIPPMAKVGGGIVDETAGAAVVSPEL